MISLDTETLGIDFEHGAKPYFVTICDEALNITFYEWPVDPLTRQPQVPASDYKQIWEQVSQADALVLQNAVFDVRALSTLSYLADDGPRKNMGTILGGGYAVSRMRGKGGSVLDWPWEKTWDTLLAGHLLASNRPHDLTSMTFQYVGHSIKKVEDDLQEATLKARRLIQQARLRIKRSGLPKKSTKTRKSERVLAKEHEFLEVAKVLAEWRIAEKGGEDMPSAKDKTWKIDGWLPRTLVSWLWSNSEAGRFVGDQENLKGRILEQARALEGWSYHPPEVCQEGAHTWWTVLQHYANADSEATLLVYKAQAREIRRRGLWEIYQHRMKIPGILYRMQRRGVTMDAQALGELKAEYAEESARLSQTCVNIAKSYGYDLEMPKSGNNDSLKHFCFGRPVEEPDTQGIARTPLFPGKKEQFLNLPLAKRTKKGGQPSLDKEALAIYQAILPATSKAAAFVRCLVDIRQRNTSLSYMESYERFWLPVYDQEGNPSRVWRILHPSLNPTGTATLRLSSQNPNSQNISKRGIDMPCQNCHGEGCQLCNDQGTVARNLRYCFGPGPGREWWSFDAENIELRLPAYEGGEEAMIELFEHPKAPPYYGSNHLLNFHTVYPDIWNAALKSAVWEWEDDNYGKRIDESLVGPYCKKKFAATWYQWCKNGGFAVQYGAIERDGGTGTADRAFHKPGAHALLKSRFKAIHGKGGLNERCIRYAEKYGYVETLPDRTVNERHGYPLLCTRTERGQILPTVPLNYRVQGTACWWMLSGMVKCQDKLDEWRAKSNFDGYIVMQIHDELVFDFPKSQIHPKDFKDEDNKSQYRRAQCNLWRARELRDLMASCGQDLVPAIPTSVTINYHEKNWSEAKGF